MRKARGPFIVTEVWGTDCPECGRVYSASSEAGAKEPGRLCPECWTALVGCSHEWVNTGTAYGGDDPRWHGEGRCYCRLCGADGDG